MDETNQKSAWSRNRLLLRYEQTNLSPGDCMYGVVCECCVGDGGCDKASIPHLAEGRVMARK